MSSSIASECQASASFHYPIILSKTLPCERLYCIFPSLAVDMRCILCPFQTVTSVLTLSKQFPEYFNDIGFLLTKDHLSVTANQTSNIPVKQRSQFQNFYLEHITKTTSIEFLSLWNFTIQTSIICISFNIHIFQGPTRTTHSVLRS